MRISLIYKIIYSDQSVQRIRYRINALLKRIT